MNYNDEFYHHGIKGMKWGVRRYQNKDGTLTPRGKKRYDKEMARLKAEEQTIKNRERTKAKIEKLDAKKAELAARKQALDGKPEKQPLFKSKKPKVEESPQKPIKDMSDQELQAVVNRLSLEQRYAQLNPPKVSAGKKFVDDYVRPVVGEVGKNTAKALLDKGAKKLFGLEKGMSEYDKLKEEAGIVRFKQQIEDYNKKHGKKQYSAPTASELLGD